MLTKHFNKKNRNEYGLSMIELLVVIVIIGILAATAIGVTLNQRKKANDSAVESDVRNTVMAIETALVDQPNTRMFVGDLEDSKLDILLDSTVVDTINLSNGVSVNISNVGASSNRVYEVSGTHENGTGGTKERFVYNSSTGTFQWRQATGG